MAGGFCQKTADKYAKRKVAPMLNDLKQGGVQNVNVTVMFDGDTLDNASDCSNYSAELSHIAKALLTVAGTLDMTVTIDRFVICKLLKKKQEMKYQRPDVVSEWTHALNGTGSDVVTLTVPSYDYLKANKMEIRNYWGISVLKQFKRLYPMFSVYLCVTGGGDVVRKELDEIPRYPGLVKGVTFEHLERHDDDGKNQKSQAIADIVELRKNLGCAWTLLPPRNKPSVTP
jgi:hypothetical protein